MAGPQSRNSLASERIRSDLELDDVPALDRTALDVPGRIGPVRGIEPTALPTRARIVDATIKAATVEALRVRHAHNDPLLLVGEEREQRVRASAGCDRNVISQPSRAELIDPVVVVELGADVRAFIGRTRLLIERP